MVVETDPELSLRQAAIWYAERYGVVSAAPGRNENVKRLLRDRFERWLTDRYGHLMPGNEDEAAALLDAFLARASDTAARASLAPAMS